MQEQSLLKDAASSKDTALSKDTASSQDKESTKENTVTTRNERFVNYLLETCNNSKGFAAKLRRADNPISEYQSWELLARFGIDLNNDYQRVTFVTISAVIARSRANTNGNMTLGFAIAESYKDNKGNDSDQAKARLLRLLTCRNSLETCRILKPLFSLIHSKVSLPLDYIHILNQLSFFDKYQQSIKAQWAQEFYRWPLLKANDQAKADGKENNGHSNKQSVNEELPS